MTSSTALDDDIRIAFDDVTVCCLLGLCRPSFATEATMPERKTIEAAQKDKEEGKAPSTQAGEFVREEMEHIRAGKHGARSPKQAIAIGLSKARRAGVKLAPPKKGPLSEKTRPSAEQAG